MGIQGAPPSTCWSCAWAVGSVAGPDVHTSAATTWFNGPRDFYRAIADPLGCESPSVLRVSPPPNESGRVDALYQVTRQRLAADHLERIDGYAVVQGQQEIGRRPRKATSPVA